jgi:hypothetical protein
MSRLINLTHCHVSLRCRGQPSLSPITLDWLVLRDVYFAQLLWLGGAIKRPQLADWLVPSDAIIVQHFTATSHSLASQAAPRTAPGWPYHAIKCLIPRNVASLTHCLHIASSHYARRRAFFLSGVRLFGARRLFLPRHSRIHIYTFNHSDLHWTYAMNGDSSLIYQELYHVSTMETGFVSIERDMLLEGHKTRETERQHHTLSTRRRSQV